MTRAKVVVKDNRRRLRSRREICEYRQEGNDTDRPGRRPVSLVRRLLLKTTCGPRQIPNDTILHSDPFGFALEWRVGSVPHPQASAGAKSLLLTMRDSPAVTAREKTKTHPEAFSKRLSRAGLCTKTHELSEVGSHFRVDRAVKGVVLANSTTPLDDSGRATRVLCKAPRGQRRPLGSSVSRASAKKLRWIGATGGPKLPPSGTLVAPGKRRFFLRVEPPEGGDRFARRASPIQGLQDGSNQIPTGSHRSQVDCRPFLGAETRSPIVAALDFRLAPAFRTPNSARRTQHILVTAVVRIVPARRNPIAPSAGLIRTAGPTRLTP